MIKEACETAKGILIEHRASMELIVQRLRIEETIDAAQLDAILVGPQPDARASLAMTDPNEVPAGSRRIF
jgi:ATP-dependent Zn protease